MKKLFFIVLFSMSVIACGGGGSSDDPNDPGNTPDAGNESVWGSLWNTELSWQ